MLIFDHVAQNNIQMGFIFTWLKNKQLLYNVLIIKKIPFLLQQH
jgi:hypothetical protein